MFEIKPPAGPKERVIQIRIHEEDHKQLILLEKKSSLKKSEIIRQMICYCLKEQ